MKYIGSTTDTVGPTTIGTFADRPVASSANTGFLYFATDVVSTYISDGAGWTRTSHPAGMEVVIAGSIVPAGFVFAYGQTLNANTSPQYTDLFNAIGTTYGGSGISSFILPDLRGRVPVALDNMGGSDATVLSVANTLGLKSGTETHTLTRFEVPVHTHSSGSLSGSTGGGSIDDGGHAYPTMDWQGAVGHTGFGGRVGRIDGNAQYLEYTGVPAQSVTVNNGTTENGASNGLGTSPAHNNMQPYILQNWAIKL